MHTHTQQCKYSPVIFQPIKEDEKEVKKEEQDERHNSTGKKTPAPPIASKPKRPSGKSKPLIPPSTVKPPEDISPDKKEVSRTVLNK